MNMNSTMEKLSMCRICLSDVTPLCSIVNTHLHEIYETLTKLPFVTKDRSPIRVCDLCCASLENSHELRRKCLQSEELFTQLLRSNVQVNLEIMLDRHLSLRDVIQAIPTECDSVEVKQEGAEEAQDDDSASPNSEDVTERWVLKVEMDTDDEMPSFGEDALFQPSDSEDAVKKDHLTEEDAPCGRGDAEPVHDALGLSTELDLPLDVVKEESQDADSGFGEDALFQPSDSEDAVKKDHLTEDDAPCGRGDAEPVHDALGLSTELDLPLDVVKEESDDLDSDGRVPEKDLIATQKHYKGGASNNLQKSEEKTTAQDKMVDMLHMREDCSSEQNKSTNSSSSNKKQKKKNKLDPLSCDTCQKCFTRKSHLDSHILIHTGEKPYQCNVCKKYFNNKGNLNVHIRTHTDEKPYQCNMCEKCFLRKDSLIIHIRTHTNEKPHKCNVCEKSFNQKKYLDIHMRTHTGEKHPHQCNICKKYFSVKCNLDMHTRIHTGEKPYECDVCKKCFISKYAFDIHMRTHNGDKHLYQCNICEKYFSMKSYLNRHTRRHTGVKPYECDICKKRFIENSHLNAHLRTHIS